MRWQFLSYWVTSVVGPAQAVLYFWLIAATTPLTVSIGLFNIVSMSSVCQKGLSSRAMEIFNTLVETYIEDGQPVEFGQTLIILE